MDITNNKRGFRYEVALPDGEFAYLEYRWLKGNMVLMRTLVPAAARKTGIGSALVKHVLDHARAAGLKVVVYCGFADKYIQTHPEYADLKAVG